MKCLNCGVPLPENSKFCAKCGTRVDTPEPQNPMSPENPAQPPVAPQNVLPNANTTPVTPAPAPVNASQRPGIDFDTGTVPAPPSAPVYQVTNQELPNSQGDFTAVPAVNRRKHLWIPILVVVVAILTAGILMIYNMLFAGMNGLYRVFDSTSAAYAKEMDAFTENNPVLSKLHSLTKDSFSMTATMAEYELKFHSDVASKIASMELDIPLSSYASGSNLEAKMFLTKDKLVVGAENVLYAESSYKDLKEQLQLFADNNNLDLDLSEWDGKIDTDTSKNKNSLFDDAYALYKSFMATSDMKKTEDFIKIGDKEEKCVRYDLDFLGSDFSGWIEKDLTGWFKNSDDSLHQMVMSSLESSPDYSEESILDELQEMADSVPDDLEMTISFFVYKDVVVSLEATSSENDVYMNISATGGDYRLNRISMEMYDGYETTSLLLEGNHIGSANINTVMTVKDDYDTATYEFLWDTDKQIDNFTVKSTEYDLEEEYSFTFASQNDQVLLAIKTMDISVPEINMLFDKLENPVQLPENTVPLSEVILEDIAGSLSAEPGLNLG